MTTGGQTQSFDELSAQLQAGINPYEVIGRLYVATLAKDQAIALAAQALKLLMPKEPLPTEGPDVNPDGSPTSPSPTPDTPVFDSVADLPKDAPEGTIVGVVAPVTRSPRSRKRGR